jgi:uncharacterized protein (TIGR02271 family)
MTMTAQQLATCIGQDAVDSDGDKIGEIVDVYVDDDTGQPEWLAVRTGWFGSNISFVPITGSTTRKGNLFVGWPKDHIKAAPDVDPDGRLTPEEEDRLYAHYDMTALGTDVRGTADVTTKGGTDEAMTRSEEELRLHRERREAGRARLHKWVETEHVAAAVPVEKDRVYVEREPITSENIDRAMSGPDISEAEHEIVLEEERATADTEVVPKERVRLQKDTVVEEQQVDADLRKERIGMEADAPRGPR